MSIALPDKWIRKVVFDQINNIVVDTVTIPCFDTYVSLSQDLPAYVLLTTQTSITDNGNKCNDMWESSILIDIVTRYPKGGNTGSRLFADNIAEAVRGLTNSLTLDVSSGLYIVWQRQDFENDISTITDNENVFRKLLRIEMLVDSL